MTNCRHQQIDWSPTRTLASEVLEQVHLDLFCALMDWRVGTNSLVWFRRDVVRFRGLFELKEPA